MTMNWNWDWYMALKYNWKYNKTRAGIDTKSCSDILIANETMIGMRT